jgi:serine/threonine-protein kinase
VVSEYDRLVGQTLDGRYQILRKIGEGGMGVVFAARHVVIERPLAVKVLRREVMRDSSIIKRFVQEAKAASRTGHPNIVDVTDFGTTSNGLTYQVMEFLEGPTLAAVIARSAPLSADRAVRIATQIARALGSAHEKRIIHRDIKPDNIFLLERGGRSDFVKIVDFGIAKMTAVTGTPTDAPRLTKAGSVFGTPEYMSPEQAAGRDDIDRRADIYALGIITYEMLTGHVPLRGDSPLKTLSMQISERAVLPSRIRSDLRVPPALEAAVMRALEKNPEDRFGTMAELVSDFEKAVEPAQPLEEPPPRVSSALKLAPLPPGADAAAIAAARVPSTRPTTPRPASSPPPTLSPQPTSSPSPVRRRPSTRRYRDEPQFVASDRPLNFTHIDEHAAKPTPRRRRRLGYLAAIALGGTAVAALGVIAARQRAASLPAGFTEDARGDVAPPFADAADSLRVAELPVDAALGADAGLVVDAASGPADAGLVPAALVALRVVTMPPGAQVYIGKSLVGKDGVAIRRAPGTKEIIRCALPAGTAATYDPGAVDAVWPNSSSTIACKLKRRKVCVQDLKNPFDQCPD